jgi:hypothetical protein
MPHQARADNSYFQIPLHLCLQYCAVRQRHNCALGADTMQRGLAR